VDFRSAVAQAEVEDREIAGAYHDISFQVEGGDSFVISTTRPELLPACIAVVAHPDDERYKKYFGKFAVTPLFHARVPILPAQHADPEKGTGILMVCTFGDAMDVEWWKGSGLPIRQVIGENGSLLEITFGRGAFESADADKANRAMKSLAGLSSKKAKARIAELLAEPGSSVDGKNAALQGDPRPITHPVKFYEKGSRPLEFISTRQWFVSTMKYKDELIGQGRKIQWHPEHMRSRYENWVEGLNQDWCISRQRYFGVSFPVWYRLDSKGNPDYADPIFALSDMLPVDPLSEPAPGFNESQRDVPGGFTGDPDVMDTWATSSLTPQIATHWSIDDARHAKLFPSDIRPQAHEIIRTWAFSTIVKAWMHENAIPWKHIVISGWILDPDRKKMSKSKGNVITPAHLLKEYSSDAVRYWAGRARLGTDTIFDEAVLKIGRKLATKIFNASRFVLSQVESASKGTIPGVDKIQHDLDLALMSHLRVLVDGSTRYFEKFEYAGALQATEDSFWGFCDHYLELVKKRTYAENESPGKESAISTLHFALRLYLRLFAPFFPYVTEEVWSWRYQSAGRDASVHTANWPTTVEFGSLPKNGDEELFSIAAEVLGHIRGAKTAAQKGLKWPVEALTLKGPVDVIGKLKLVVEDILNAGNVELAALKYDIGDTPKDGRVGVQVVLAKE
ncbi:MAG: valine--tRNA ligase, partial [Bdellovibrionales bacterium]|nr:valine--tRNA ligase [Bdellovibrionales bacterium]